MSDRSVVAAIHQPNLFPRLKVLQKIFDCDVYIIFDDAQFVRNDWQNRVWIRNLKSKEPFWLNIPVHKPSGQKSLINEVTIINPHKTAQLVRKQISEAYSASPFWFQIHSYINDVFTHVLNSEQVYLNDFLYESIVSLSHIIKANNKIVCSSDVSYPLSNEKNMHLIELCKFFDATAYVCGSGGLNYIDAEIFDSHHINLIIQDWNEDIIRADYEDIAWRNFSFIDFWARFGLEELKRIIWKDSNGSN